MKRGRPGRSLAVGLSALLAAADPVGAQQIADYAFIKWAADVLVAEPTLPDPAGIDSLQSSKDSHAARRVEVEMYFHANGDIEQTQTIVTDYADAAGINEEGNGVAFVNGFSERLRIDEAYVTTPDGRIIPVEADTVQVLLEDDGGVFTNDHTVVIPFASLAPGAASTLRFTLLSAGDRRAAPYSQLMFPQTGTPTGHFEMRVSWDEGMPAPDVSKDSPFIECVEGDRTMRCVASEIPASPTDFDVNYLDEIGQLVVGEATSWSDLSSLLGGYVDNAFTDDEAVAEVVADVIAGADTDREKLLALHNFVASQIRYVGIETGVNGIVPRATGLTLERRFGDCKDKTALFLQMAEIAGLSASPVVVSSHRKNPQKLITPSLAYFDHMVACVDLDGEEVCIDLTDPYTPTLAAQNFLSAAAALSLAPGTGSVTQFDRIGLGWTLRVESHNRLEGATVYETERRVFGPGYSGAMRSALAGLNRTELERWVRNAYEEIYGTDPELEIGVTGIAEQQTELVVETSTALESTVLPDRPLRYEHYPGWLVDFVQSFYSANEHFAYRFGGFAYDEETRFVIDEWDFEAPGSAIEFDSVFGTMRRYYAFADDTVTVRTRIELPARLIDVDELERFNNYLDTIIDNSIIRFRARPRGR